MKLHLELKSERALVERVRLALRARSAADVVRVVLAALDESPDALAAVAVAVDGVRAREREEGGMLGR